jgi:transposase
MNSNEINWEAIKREYGAKSNRALAIEYGCAESTIRKRADKEKWKKAKVRSKKVRTRVEVRTEANPVGCPTVKTVKLMETIFDAIANGKSTRAVCKEIGISTTTFFRWARNDREFQHQYACAKRFCADFFVEDIIEIADDDSRDTYIDEKGREVVDHEVIARSKIRIEARQWAATRLNSRKYNLPMLESTDEKPTTRRIEVSFVSGDGVVSAGRTFDQNGKVVQLGPIKP